MSVLMEDSPRNLLAWIQEAHAHGVAAGAVLTPFATPWASRPHRRGVKEVARVLHDASAQVWFDPTTHALQMGGVGDFRYYDEYDLWGGPRGEVGTPAARDEHVQRVFAVQELLGCLHLAPTILLHHAESGSSEQALELARAAVDADPGCWLSVAGTSPFWASGDALDAHIGALAQLEPGGWFLTVVRPHLELPVAATSSEVYGLARTSRALSEYAPIHISHGDLAALPAVAAGASSVGSGWDQRQRVCAFPSYASRDPNGSGGGWYERPTYPGLIGSLTVPEARVLARQAAGLAQRLGPPPPPGPKEACLHHLDVLDQLVAKLVAEREHERRYQLLRGAYEEARREWPDVTEAVGSATGAGEWIGPFLAGLESYGADEGW